MTAYWLLFFLPLLGVLMPGPLAPDARRLVWLGMATVAALAIGLRREVGADWGGYADVYESTVTGDFAAALLRTDPAYAALNWVSARFGWGIYGVNLACGALFVAGLAAFARRQPLPWLAWLIATPYLLIVVVMGYSRQGVALGFVFWALAYLEEKRVWGFVLLVTLGAMFHGSAALMLPLIFLVRRKTDWLHLLFLIAATLAFCAFFLLPTYETLWSAYVEQRMVSEGGEVRVWMNAVPAAVLLALARPWRRHWPDPGHWRWIALLAIASLLFVGMASTAVDRVALYFSPLQVYVWARFPLLFRDQTARTGIVVGICGSYAAVMWIWLNFAIHAHWWLPYRSILLP